MTRPGRLRNILYHRLFGIKNENSEFDELRKFLTVLLGLILLISIIIGIIQLALGFDTLFRTGGTVFFAILPAYILVRRGWVRTSVSWIVISFTGFIVFSAFTDIQDHSSFSRLFDYIMPLTLMPVLAALVVRPGLALAASITNSVVTCLLFIIWETAQPQSFQNNEIISGLVIPLFVQIVLGVVCTGLAGRLRRMTQLSAEQITLRKAILDQLPVGVAVYLPDILQKTPVYCNNFFEKFIGAVDPTSLSNVKREPNNVQAPENLGQPPPVAEWPWNTAIKENTFGESNATVLHADGHTINLHEVTSRINAPGTDQLLYILYVATDIGREQALNQTISKLFNQTGDQLRLVNESYQRLTELDRLKGEFLANVSHELRTPLSIILANTEIMTIARPPESPLIKNIEAIYTAAHHLRTLVNDILDAAKLDSNQLMIDRQLLDLRTPIELAAKAMEVLAAEKQLRLVVTVPDQPVMVMGDERRLAQIGLNLLSNAIKFTQRGTVSIQVFICPDESVAHISVQDTGVGIEPPLQSYLFERFVQIRPISGKRGGTGIGLSIARSLAKLHDGDIWLKHSAVNQGSTFICEIPLAPNLISVATTTPP